MYRGRPFFVARPENFMPDMPETACIRTPGTKNPWAVRTASGKPFSRAYPTGCLPKIRVARKKRPSGIPDVT